MMLKEKMGHLLTICLLLFCYYPMSLGRYTAEPESGSGEGDGTTFLSSTPTYDIVGATTESSVKNVNGTTTSINILESIKNFLNDYMLLVIVVGSLVALLIFIMCAAVIMSHRHKASAYYPSSFAPKEYVNHDDKNGGTTAFNEIPEKSHHVKVEEVVTSTNQLQADILSAAQNLRSPTKCASSKEQKIQEEPPKTQELSQKKKHEDTSSDSSSDSSDSEDETPRKKVEEIPAEQPEEPKPTGDSQDAPTKPTEETKPTDSSQETPAQPVEETKPSGDSQETPTQAAEENNPTGDSKEAPAQPAEETIPTNQSQEDPTEGKIDVPNVPVEVSGKVEEVNPTPTDCSVTNNSCGSQESAPAPETQPCGV